MIRASDGWGHDTDELFGWKDMDMATQGVSKHHHRTISCETPTMQIFGSRLSYLSVSNLITRSSNLVLMAYGWRG